MAPNIKDACLLLALLAGSSQNAYGVRCFQIVGRDNSVIYSATQPPFLLAGQDWTEGQQRLRAAGQHLLWFEIPACPNVALPRSTSVSNGTGDPAAPLNDPSLGSASRLQSKSAR